MLHKVRFYISFCVIILHETKLEKFSEIPNPLWILRLKSSYFGLLCKVSQLEGSKRICFNSHILPKVLLESCFKNEKRGKYEPLLFQEYHTHAISIQCVSDNYIISPYISKYENYLSLYIVLLLTNWPEVERQFKTFLMLFFYSTFFKLRCQEHLEDGYFKQGH